MTIFDKIQELRGLALMSKHEQLVTGIINAINERILVQGNMLPSVNVMVREVGFARKTIVKAYEELKERGIIESKNRLGYFITNVATDQRVKVAVLLYAFHTFQEIFYNKFREQLGENIQLDIYFHHNNIEVFETILNNIKRRYAMYVVAPIHGQRTRELLGSIPPNKLLIVDRFENLGPEYSYISQEFEQSTYKILSQLKESIERFDELILFFKENTDYPLGAKKAFERFINDHQINGHIQTEYVKGSLEKGKVYFTIGDTDLWKILKDAMDAGIEIGEDIGILSHNDTPVKEIVCGGITTYYSDFEAMGIKAASYVLEKDKIQEILTMQLSRRKSL
ncbi:MAG: GntR family transcriptional regulator [Bacteroidota bacterium]